MVVEDYEDTRLLLKQALEGFGYRKRSISPAANTRI
jgi:CheY-like chemotaxis protein